jgi:DNA-directed RNA polymerase subunit RPC12/RpoP
MNTCPHCGLPALRFWKKMVVGPARDVYCPNCRNRIGVKVVPAYLSFVPALILIVWIPYMRHEDAMIAAGIGAFLVTIALYWWCVPLERRGLSLKREGAAVSPTSPQ